jgi:hypothetical protein
VLITQVMPSAAVVVLVSPIALNAAASSGISPYTLMMTVALAASASFASPVAHPAHLLVMGPGGYRFGDYVRIGGPHDARRVRRHHDFCAADLAAVSIPAVVPPHQQACRPDWTATSMHKQRELEQTTIPRPEWPAGNGPRVVPIEWRSS